MTTAGSELAENTTSLTQSIIQAVHENFADQDAAGESAALYNAIMNDVEKPLFKAVMEHCKYNQSRAAHLLGISRGTLRTKLRQYFGDKYVGSRE